MKLYTYWRSSCSWRVRIALNFKGLEFESIPINLLKKEHLGPEYTKINPNNVVPALVLDDGQTFTQSIAIIELLEELYPNSPSLLPKDAFLRAQVRQIALMIACDIHPLQNLRILIAIGEDRKVEWSKTVITNGFKALEIQLRETCGKYSVGDCVTIADCCLVPQVYNACRFGVDMEEFPLIRQIHDELMKLDAVKASCPDAQGDSVQQG